MGGNFDFDETQNFNGQMFWLDSTSRFSGDRLAIAKNKWRNYTTELAYKRTFPTQGQELTASVQYSRNKSNNSSTFTTNSFDTSCKV